MIKKLRLYFFIAGIGISSVAVAQDEVKYQTPPKEISELLLAKPTPSISLGSKAEWVLFSERNSYPSVEELAMPEYRIAGLRINPNNYTLSRQTYINNFSLKDIKNNQVFEISGLPASLLASNISWNPSRNKIAFTQVTQEGVDLYLIDLASKSAKKINQNFLNLVLGSGLTWLNDDTILYRVATQPASNAPKKPLKPIGPAIQQNLGKAAPSVTYQDLIKTPYDEQLFEFYGTSQLVKNTGGVETKIGPAAIYKSVRLSPDKNYMLVETINKPFSYLVSAMGFPSTIKITDANGKEVVVLANQPSSEATPSGYDNVQDIQRGFSWRDDEAATVYWAKPLDKGLIKTEVAFHDAVYALSAPFTGKEKELFKTKTRYRGVQWGNASLALVSEGLRSKQTSTVSRYNPSNGTLEELYTRNQTDAYNDLGSPVTTKNAFGREVIMLVDKGSKLLMNNTVGSSEKGDLLGL